MTAESDLYTVISGSEAITKDLAVVTEEGFRACNYVFIKCDVFGLRSPQRQFFRSHELLHVLLAS